MSSVSRVRPVDRGIALTFLVLALTVGCTATSDDPPIPPAPPQGAPPPPRSSVLPGDCTITVSDPGQAPIAVAAALPGDTVCFTGGRLTDVVVEMTASGIPGKPITLTGDGTTMSAIRVDADHVVVDGFTLVNGDGINLRGEGVVARNNVLRNAFSDGLVCTGCVGATLESNTVWRADGTGIVIDGDRSTVRDNIVLESVMREEGDADGVRFFGTGLRLVNNTIKDIKATGYPGRDAPHTDCFQTYDNRDSRPTHDVVIADNLCENVDVQCLIATSDATRNTTVPPGGRTIIFERNNCTVNGAQGLLLEDFPNVMVRDNKFAGPQYRAVFVAKGSVNTTVVGNIVTGDIPPFEIDDESRPGFHAEGNFSR